MTPISRQLLDLPSITEGVVLESKAAPHVGKQAMQYFTGIALTIHVSVIVTEA